MAGKDMPTGVKVTSIFYYIVGALTILGGILALAGGSFLGSLIPGMGTMFGSIIAVVGVIVIIFGILEIFVANGLWKLKKWAKITAIVLSVLGVIGGLNSLASKAIAMGIVWIIVYGLIIWYLGFHKETKGLFK